MDTNETYLKAERHSQIRRLVEQKGRVTVPELRLQFEVSEATIRRDLEELDGLGWIRRTHGGAVKLDRVAIEPPILQRMSEQSLEKARIGQAAASLVKEGETIFLGSGTTVLEIARCLPSRLHLTVITNSLPVVNQLASNEQLQLVVIGGLLRQTELSMVGHVAEQALGEFHADRLFMGMRAIDVHHGFTSDYLPETITDRLILGIASQVVVVADHQKFGRLSSVVVGPVTSANLIITDKATPQAYVDELRLLGIDVWQV
jgi:DeoR/GlpR family transcriptional regulator of sugar metabolism